jgi:hypothetical protein
MYKYTAHIRLLDTSKITYRPELHGELTRSSVLATRLSKALAKVIFASKALQLLKTEEARAAHNRAVLALLKVEGELLENVEKCGSQRRSVTTTRTAVTTTNPTWPKHKAPDPVRKHAKLLEAVFQPGDGPQDLVGKLTCEATQGKPLEERFWREIVGFRRLRHDTRLTVAKKFLERSVTSQITHVAIKFGLRVECLPRPNRHHHVLHAINLKGGRREERGVEGFLTSDGDFLTREEAYTLAKRNGQFARQMRPGCYDGPKLFSEDLW